MPIFLFGLIFFSFIVNAQIPPNIQWQQAYGGNGAEGAQSIQQTSDGGYIVAGYATSNSNGDVPATSGSLDFWVVKLKSTEAVRKGRPFLGSNFLL